MSLVPKSISLSESADRYLDHLRGRDAALKTIEAQRLTLRRFIAHVGDRRTAGVTQAMVEDFFYGPDGLGRRVIASTFNQQRATINTFYIYLLKRRLVSTDWMMGITRKAEVQAYRQRLSAAELLALPDYARDERDKAMITMACNCPARAGELVSMRIKDIDLETGLLTLYITKTRMVREKPISVELDEAMRRWLTIYTQKVGALQPDYYLFPSRGPRPPIWEYQPNGRRVQVGHGEAPLRPDRPMSHPEHVVHIALGRAGFQVTNEGFHTIRRSVARAYFDSLCADGYDYALRTVMALLDHKSAATTERYIGISTEEIVLDRTIRGKPFLRGMVTRAGDNVLPLMARRDEA